MNYADILKQNLSRKVIDEITLSVLGDETNFEAILGLLYHSDYQISWRATWACEKIIELNPHIVNDQRFEKIIELTLSTNIDGQRRLLLSIISKLNFIFTIPVSVINKCFEWMISENQPIAVQALSLKILTQFCSIEPDLKSELLAYVDNYADSIDSPAMISAFKKARKQLNINK